MDITFSSRSLEKKFNKAAALRRTFGERIAKSVMIRLEVLVTAQNLAEVPVFPPLRRHQLTGNRQRQFSIDLVHPYRLIFEPNHDPVPRKDDGGIDTGQVVAITILGVVDYH